MSKLTATPTLNGIPLRHGDFATTTEALAYAAQGEAGFNFYNVFGQLTDVLSYRQLQSRAMLTARYLKRQGFARSDRVVMVAETTPEFMILFFACQYVGLVPCPTAFSVNLGGMPAYIDKLSQLMQSSQAVAIVAPEKVADYLRQPVTAIGKKLLTVESIIQHPTQSENSFSVAELMPLTADEPAYIQFSSGSTTSPKGVEITQRSLLANISVVLRVAMKLRAEDRSFNWLPFHHNMGLIGFFLASVYGQRSVDCLSAENFVQNPLVWLELMSANKTAITFSPVFGYQMAMKKYAESENKPALDLSSLRVAGIGGDMISVGMLNSFSACFANSGFRYQAFLPSYGLTETTLAVSAADVDSQPFTDKLADDPAQKEMVSCGKPLPGFEVKIIDAQTGQRLPEHQVGQIWVKGPSVITRYIDSQHQIITDDGGFIYTGDLGYLYQQQLFISGREKEVIIIRGRNIWAQDIEWLVLQALPHIGGNNVAAIGVANGQEEKLTVLVHLSDKQQDISSLSAIIKQEINRATGINAQAVFIIDKLPLTASGKLARTQAKERYLSQSLTVIGHSEEHQ